MSKEENQEKKQEALRLIRDMNTLVTRQVLLEREKREFMERLKGFIKKHNSIPRELVGAQDKLFPGSGVNSKPSEGSSAIK